MPYPIFVNLRGRRCVIVGGGRVAERRAESLLDQECEIIIIAPKATDRIAELSGSPANVQWRKMRFAPQALDGALLAIAATNDSGVNAAVADAASQRGVLVCRADEPESGDFITPAVLQRGSLIVALSTGGASPTLAAVLITRLKTVFGPEWGALTALFARIRPEIQAVTLESSRRMLVTTILENKSILEQIQQGDMDAAVAEAIRCI